MKFFLLILVTFPILTWSNPKEFELVQVGPLNLEGHYYVPLYQAPDSASYEPEGLRTIKADGTYEIRTLHGGAQEIYQGNYTIKGQLVTFHKGHYLAKCESVFNLGDEEFTVRALRTESSLTLIQGSESQTFQVASEDQVQRVRSAPVCGH